MQPRRDALAAWRSDTALTVTLFGDNRLRRPDPRLRLPLAGDPRARGRRSSTTRCAAASTPRSIAAAAACGTGTSARGRVFWSHSMFDMLGIEPHDDLLDLRRDQRAGASGRRRSLRHSPPQLADAKTPRSITLSACGTPAATGCGCARAASWSARPAKPVLHLIGIAVDITEQKKLAEKTATADCACATPSRPSPKPSCCGTPTTASCCAIRNSRTCTTCPTRRSRPGTPYENRSAPAPSRVVRTQIAERRRTAAAARAPSRRSSTTGAGCRSANAAPRTAATSRSAPTSPR